MSTTLAVNITAMRYPNAPDPGNLIEGLAFEVPADGSVAFLGRSGVGKTTLLRIIAGLERRFSGEVLLGGKPIRGPSRDLQLVFQDYRLMPWKTVYDNVAFAVRPGDDSAAAAQVERWLKIVGLTERRDAWPRTLSGGEQGRVAFARALIDQPQVLLLDEPFRALDLVSRFDLQAELLAALQAQPATVLLVSHSVEDAVFFADQVYVLSDNRMRIEASYEVDVPRPRERGDRRLSALAADITTYLSARPERRSAGSAPGHQS